MSQNVSESLTPAAAGSPRRAAVAHVVPFIAWMLLMSALGWFGADHAWKYAARTGVCALLCVYLRPWRWYPAAKLKNIPWAVAAGALVYVIWVFPEMTWGPRMPWIQEMYLRFGVRPLGEFPVADLLSNGKNMYDPAVCGWPLSLIRLGGSAFVIAVIEEFFFRGFLYRWIIDRDFTRVDIARFDWEAFGMMVLMFGIEHHRWLAGMLAGVIYLFVMLKTRDIWAAVLAHVITNFMLAVYVLKSGYYAFW
ncbi:MAG: CAAX prenyl protease-related protein [Lentisphaeria bacterium]|nr:CAAX prenyl protease-related protein [Lentisphaeria bacterium]